MRPERSVEQMAKRTGHDSFIILAEWLKENRTSLEARLTNQDKRLEEHRSEIVGRLDEIYTEVRRTNGRVTTLEKRDELVAALEVNKQEWEQERSVGDKEAARSRIDAELRRGDKFWKSAQVFCGLIGGGLFAALGQALGWW